MGTDLDWCDFARAQGLGQNAYHRDSVNIFMQLTSCQHAKFAAKLTAMVDGKGH